MNKTNPADGERRAILGYSNQYRVAAKLIYQALNEGDLEWIRVADPDAGRVDDIQIGRTGRVDAYQVKWSDYPGAITFTNLTSGDAKSPSLIKQLADGWKHLCKLYQSQQVRVYLVTNKTPSVNDKLPTTSPHPSHNHLQAFLRMCWNSKANWDSIDDKKIPECWLPTLRAMAREANLDSDFIQWVKTAEFLLGYTLFESPFSERRDTHQAKLDIEKIASFLWKAVGDEKRIVEFKRDALLERLGWTNRFSFRFSHEFPVDEMTYQPISKTIEDINRSLGSCTRGYIAILGTPGSGKSTTLTQLFRYYEGIRIVRYYAFVADRTEQGRGEATNFLHDLVFSLSQQGVRAEGYTGSARTREQLLEKFSGQLRTLNKDYTETGLKTVLFVDGLDHIQREQTPERSLLADLPNPGTLPDGVIFILGSQTLELDNLSNRIKTQLGQEGRTIDMARLSREACHSIIDNSNLGVEIEEKYKDLITKISEGHPLSLRYTIEALQGKQDTEAIDATLRSLPSYSGHIEEDYELYWNELKTGKALKDLLGLVCRLRNVINIKEISSWTDEQTLSGFVSQAQRFFRKETEYEWRFFHNSFRQFLLAKTAVDVLGNYDHSKHKKLHHQLAEYASRAPSDSSWSWEELNHRLQAGEVEAVLDLGTQHYFRDQYYSFRPIECIIEDIDSCLRAAKQSQNGVAIFRYLLLEKELTDREECLDQTNLTELILELVSPETALGYALNGSALRISADEALGLCLRLIHRGNKEYAYRLFESAEPLDVLKGVKRVDRYGDPGTTDTIIKWAMVALYFRPINEIFKAIKQVNVSQDIHGTENLVNIREGIHWRVESKFVNTIYKSGNSFHLGELMTFAKRTKGYEWVQRRIDLLTCQTSVDNQHPSDGKEPLQRLIPYLETLDLPQSQLIKIADLIYRIEGDQEKAFSWLKNVKQPEAYTPSQHGTAHGFEVFSDRIRLNRLLTALGTPQDPIAVVPNAKKSFYEGHGIFERMIVLVANVWGKALAGQRMSPEAILSELRPALTFYYKDNKQITNWNGWHYLTGFAKEYYRFIIKAIAAHGSDAATALANYFRQEWETPEKKRFWWEDRKRSVGLSLFKIGAFQDFPQFLSNLSVRPSAETELFERSTELESQMKALIAVGRTEEARLLLPELLHNSFGIYHDKDHQYELWIGWLDKVKDFLTGELLETKKQFIAPQGLLYRMSRGGSRFDEDGLLLELLVESSPHYALTVRNWLIKTHGVQYITSLKGLVKGALRELNPPIQAITTTIQNVILPIQVTFDSELAFMLAKATGLLPDVSPQQILEPVIEAILTQAKPTHRSQWITSLRKGLEAVNADSTWLHSVPETDSPKRHDSHESTVILKSGKELTETEALQQVNSYTDLIDLINNTQDTKYFPWNRILTPLIGSFSAEQAKTARQAIEKIKSCHQCDMLFADRMNQLGQADEAVNIAEGILLNAPREGWSKWYDGGTRMKAAQCLVAVGGREARKKVMGQFVDDYLESYRNAFQLLQSIEELSSLFWESPPYEQLWSEVENHFSQLVDFRLDNTPPLEQEPPSNYDAGLMLFDLVYQEAHSPSSELRKGAIKALADIICSTNSEHYSNRFHDYLTGNIHDQLVAVTVLNLIKHRNPSFVKMFEKEICGLSLFENQLLRTPALTITDYFEFEPCDQQEEKKEFPIIYTLELPEIPMPEQRLFGLPAPGECNHDTEDSLELLQPFYDELESLSELSTIPFQNIVHRAATLMPKIAPQNEWDHAAEVAVLNTFRGTNLELAYVRPRVRIAQLAISQVIAELVNASLLDDSDLLTFGAILEFSTPELLLPTPIPRPTSITRPSSDNLGRSFDNKNWIHEAGESTQNILTRYDGKTVLGEMTRFVKFDRDHPQEFRLSMVCHVDWPGFPNCEGPGNFFFSKREWNARNYPNIPEADKIPSAVLHSIHTESEKWLAFNPFIAQVLMNWKHDPSGLFKWTDQNGKLMAESVWWQDGFCELFDSSGDVCGEGWIVVVTDEAIDNLITVMHPFKRLGLIIRCDKEEPRYIGRDKVEDENWFSNETAS